jgi:hypothetical protein
MHIIMPRRLDCPFDLRLRPAVRAHRVQGYDAWHGGGGASWLPRRSKLRGLCNSRTWGRPDAASCARGNWDIQRASGFSANRERAGFRCELSSVAVLDLAFKFLCRRERPRSCALSKLVFQFTANILERGPPRIFHRLGARASLQVLIRTAVWTKALAVFAADNFQRDG